MEVPAEVDEIKNDLIWTKHYINQYKKLFLQNDKRLSLLNKTAKGFFRDIQRMFWDEMIIGVARLMDPYEQGKNKNLSLQTLIALAKENNWEFESEISELVLKARKLSEPVIMHRMKRVAHRDLPTAMKKVSIDTFGITELEDSLAFAGQALNVIYSNLTNSTWSWNLVPEHDVDALIYYLKLGMVYREWSEDELDWLKDNELQQKSEYYGA